MENNKCYTAVCVTFVISRKDTYPLEGAYTAYLVFHRGFGIDMDTAFMIEPEASSALVDCQRSPRSIPIIYFSVAVVIGCDSTTLGGFTHCLLINLVIPIFYEM